MNDFEINQFYESFEYPKELLKIIELNLIDLDLWFLCIEKNFVEGWIKGLRKRYPSRMIKKKIRLAISLIFFKYTIFK